MFDLIYTPTAAAQRDRLESNPSSVKVWKAVRKALALMETNLHHPGLRTHKFESLAGPGGEPVFEAYAQNRTPAAFRIFWYYGSSKNTIIC